MSSYINKFLFPTIFVIAWSHVNAQHLGISVSYHVTSFQHDSTFNKDRSTLGAGFSFERKISLTNLYFAAELNYFQVSGQGTVNYYNQSGDIVSAYEKTQQLQYLSLPLLLRYQVRDNKKWNPFIEAGCTYSYLINAWHNPQRAGIDHDVSNLFNRHQISLQAGVGLKWTPKKVAWSFGYRYQQAVLALSNSQANSSFQSHTFQVGMSLPLNRFFRKDTKSP